MSSVSKTERDAIHAALDKIMENDDARGIVMLCCAFTRGDTMRGGMCVTGIMSPDEVVQALTEYGGHLLQHMQGQVAQRCAETPPSEVVQ